MLWQFQVKLVCGANVLIFFIVTNATFIIFVNNYSFVFTSWTIMQYIKISFHDHFKNLIWFHGCNFHVVFKIDHFQICFMLIAFYIDEVMVLKFVQLSYFGFLWFHDYIKTWHSWLHSYKYIINQDMFIITLHFNFVSTFKFVWILLIILFVNYIALYSKLEHASLSFSVGFCLCIFTNFKRFIKW